MTTFAEHGIDIRYDAGREQRTTCPRCSGSRKKSREKCLAVNVPEGIWNCHHCGWSGALHSGEEVWQNRPPIRPVYTPPAPPDEGESVLPRQVLAWFAHRGIPEWVLAQAHITAAEEYCPQIEKRAMTIRYPYLRDGELVNMKYRAAPKHFWMAKGAERILYGLDGIAGADDIVIVEGEMDKLSIDAVQGPACVSVPDGAPALDAKQYASKFTFLDGVAEERLRAAKRIILATDADEPGQKLADELARRIGYAKCAKVTWPAECKDANETLVKVGPTAVCDALMEAKPYPVDGVFTHADLQAPIERLWEQGAERGFGTVVWPAFDRHYRVVPGLVTGVTGIPGSGKSIFLDNLVMHLARQHGWTFGICSPENQPLERHAAGLLAIWQGKPFFDGPTERMTIGEVREGVAWLGKHIAWILPEEPTVDAILERAEVLVYRMGISGLILDPWNEIEHSRPAGLTETEYVSQTLMRIRHWARRRGVHVWIVAHPTKMQRDEKTHKYPVPTPYNVSGSANWRNKTDAFLTVHREENEDGIPGNTPTVHIQKIRFAETGELGMVEFSYDRPTGTFREIA